jgi:uncharacterized protein YabN with tetrapyrrole methylase and pyrophosphatase domain
VSASAKSEKTFSILGCLRARVGCPWDRKQAFDIIRRYTFDETFEGLWRQAKTLEGPKL